MKIYHLATLMYTFFLCRRKKVNFFRKIEHEHVHHLPIHIYAYRYTYATYCVYNTSYKVYTLYVTM
jgi:hypothetical protein